MCICLIARNKNKFKITILCLFFFIKSSVLKLKKIFKLIRLRDELNDTYVTTQLAAVYAYKWLFKNIKIMLN